MTNAEYREAEGISRSDLFKISKSPQHFCYEQEHPQPKTEALIFGSAFHKYVLEAEDFESEFVVIPECDRRTKIGKELYAEFERLAYGKDVITECEFTVIQGMSESIYANKYAAALLQGEKEQSFFWTDELTGERCKCRPDALTSLGGLHIISDLKSCCDAGTDAFMRDCLKYGYDMQAAMYREGVQLNTGKQWEFVFIAVEKTPPYAVNILKADELILLRGQDLFRRLIGIYHNCRETGNWYGYNGFSGMINNLSLPAWLAKEYE